MSQKVLHEVRDAIHKFVEFSNDEKLIIGTPFFQRLRNIRQLSMTFFVYPGAVHTRFEHCLGAMELAGRVFDVLFDPRNRHSDSIEPFRQQLDNGKLLEHWKRHLRMAALLHDVGHPALSHATESLFPSGENHEMMTKKIIMESDLTDVLQEECEIPYKPSLVARLAVGPKYFPGEPFEPWEQILNEVIVSDAFGVDRMDYLLRDAHHCGAVAGNFDHHRLIQTLRILRPPDGNGNSSALLIGIEHGGIHPTEALLVSRFFMYMQVYLHRVSTAYNIHAKRFAKKYLEETGSSHWNTDPDRFVEFSDNELFCEISKAAGDNAAAGHADAERIVKRQHFRLAYKFDHDDAHLLAAKGVTDELKTLLESNFADENYELYLGGERETEGSPALKDDFPVWDRSVDSEPIRYGKRFSRILEQLEKPSQNFVIADENVKSDIRTRVEQFVAQKRSEKRE